MDFASSLEWVHGLARVASLPALHSMKNLMAALGNPQRRLRFVHVAGTNGKGSTVAMLASVLTQAGYKTGQNVSPYVLDFRERFQIDGKMISEEELADIFTQVRTAAETLQGPIKEFEAVTAAALVYFAAHACDIVCLEAGIGGRNDPTNIVEQTLVACLQHIGFDHMELLGETLGEIALDKCGIIKPGCTVVSYPAQPPEAAEQIQNTAAKLNCPLVVPKVEDVKESAQRGYTNRFVYKGLEVELPLVGDHQVLNAMVVIEALQALEKEGIKVTPADMQKGLAQVRFPARIEVLRSEPLVLLDGAHNEDSALALAEVLKQNGAQQLAAVVGALQDKQVEKLLEILAPYIHILYAVKPNHARAMQAEALAQLAQPLVSRVVLCTSSGQAVEQALANSSGMLVCGSFYLASQVRPMLLERLKREGEEE